jgi:hypothetical protein
MNNENLDLKNEMKIYKFNSIPSNFFTIYNNPLNTYETILLPYGTNSKGGYGGKISKFAKKLNMYTTIYIFQKRVPPYGNYKKILFYYYEKNAIIMNVEKYRTVFQREKISQKKQSILDISEKNKEKIISDSIKEIIYIPIKTWKVLKHPYLYYLIYKISFLKNSSLLDGNGFCNYLQVRNTFICKYISVNYLQVKCKLSPSNANYLQVNLTLLLLSSCYYCYGVHTGKLSSLIDVHNNDMIFILIPNYYERYINIMKIPTIFLLLNNGNENITILDTIIYTFCYIVYSTHTIRYFKVFNRKV